MEELIKRLERVIATGAPDKDGMHPISAETVLEVVKRLPPAEPKIIRCKDCKWNRTKNRKETTQWLPCRALVTPDDFSCIHAERREVTE